MSPGPRVLVALAGVGGCAGVALAAASAHIGGPNLATAAYFLLFHAPALLGVALAADLTTLPRRPTLAAGALLALGVALFSGALALGALAEWRPVPMAAPTGGFLLMGGWLLLAGNAVFARAR
ncbi:hypothetical protein GCM10007036_04610 [Alsobacter metallidurans]|uniref:DUF423 domain-containing protein n=1 Tax=Alsobacter metallidurans TaxID=340221 RepID=A0A917I4K0_9HYPH|nr:DUF423 domain-containing protein [Alsobacter metallidurans]GGH08871.1 hypothetical protein GCM10007036_04610 [Alsobacter metallidurans]